MYGFYGQLDLKLPFHLSRDHPRAIAELTAGFQADERSQDAAVDLPVDHGHLGTGVKQRSTELLDDYAMRLLLVGPRVREPELVRPWVDLHRGALAASTDSARAVEATTSEGRFLCMPSASRGSGESCWRALPC